MNKKKLIINADEYGVASCITDAINICLDNGVLTSTTIVAGGMDFERAAGFVKNKDCCGVHLSLVDYLPSSLGSMIPSLLCDNRERLHPLKTFIKRYFSNKINLNEVRIELGNQIEKCLDHHIVPTHLDGHCNLHVLPGIFAVLLELMKKYKIKKIRYPRERIYNIDWSQPVQYLIKTGIRLGCLLNRRFLSDECYSSDHFIGLAQSTRITEEVMLKLLSKLKHGSTEIPMHPGMYDEKQINEAFGSLSHAQTYFNAAADEMQALLSKSVKNYIELNKIDLISYKEL